MSVIAPSTPASTGAPSRLTNPAIPHICEGIYTERSRSVIRSSFIMEDGATVRPVIVHADDFGRDASTTHAITSWIDEGIVSSVSVLANLVGTADALVA